MHENKKDVTDHTWIESAFALIMKEYKNWVLSSKHSVAARDVFCSYLHKNLKKPDDMTPKAFTARFKDLFKLYDNLKAEF